MLTRIRRWRHAAGLYTNADVRFLVTFGRDSIDVRPIRGTEHDNSIVMWAPFVVRSSLLANVKNAVSMGLNVVIRLFH
jgi:hypothetical protein